MTWATGLVSVLAAITVSPLLAAWTVGLTTDPATLERRGGIHGGCLPTAWSSSRPWPRSWPPAPPAVTPAPAWWLFATGGAVLCVVDAQHHLLPARMVYPLAAAVLAVLVLAAVLAGEPDRLRPSGARRRRGRRRLVRRRLPRPARDGFG